MATKTITLRSAAYSTIEIERNGAAAVARVELRTTDGDAERVELTRAEVEAAMTPAEFTALVAVLSVLHTLAAAKAGFAG